MSDILSELRGIAELPQYASPLTVGQACRRAVAEIERLREDVARIKIQRDNALIDMERFANMAGVMPGGTA